MTKPTINNNAKGLSSELFSKYYISISMLSFILSVSISLYAL